MLFAGKIGRELCFFSCTDFSLKIINGSFLHCSVVCILTADSTPKSCLIVYILLFGTLQLFPQFRALQENRPEPSLAQTSCPFSVHTAGVLRSLVTIISGNTWVPLVFKARFPLSPASPSWFLPPFGCYTFK